MTIGTYNALSALFRVTRPGPMVPITRFCGESALQGALRDWGLRRKGWGLRRKGQEPAPSARITMKISTILLSLFVQT